VQQTSLSGLFSHPARVWFAVLGMIFAVEYGVMLALPLVFPLHLSWVAESAVDAVLLTVVVAPILWWTVVRPLQHIIRIRTQYLADLIATVEAERRRIAYELHDGVGQSLTMLVSGLRTMHGSPDQQDLPQRMLDLQQVALVALKDLRQLAGGLRPSLLDDLGLAPAIEQVAVNVHENHPPLELIVNVEEVAGKRLPEAVETAVFRIFQEALNNIVKHSAATNGLVRICLASDSVVLEVSDDGRGFDPHGRVQATKGQAHLGVLGMRERASLLGGTLSINAAPGGGTQVTASIPLGGAMP
jgi:signal transduction histidine kinase